MKNAILSYLKLNSWVKRKTLIQYLINIGYEEANDRSVSLALNELSDIDGHLIVSGGKGIKLAQTAEECQQAIDFFRSYALSYLHKVRIAKRNFKRLTRPQLFEV